MRLIRNSSKDITIEITPLLDILFLLLIFFMVSYRYTEQAIEVDLPSATMGVEQNQRETVEIYITKEEEIYIGKSKVDMSKMGDYLSEYSKDEVIYIRGDREVSYQKIVQIMDYLSQINFKKISLITTE